MSSDFGAVSRLHELVSTAAQWCQEHGVRRYGAELDALAERITEIGEELHLVHEGLAGELAGRSERLAAAVSRSPGRPARTPAAAASPALRGTQALAPRTAETPPPAVTGPAHRRSAR
ncbi:hypothetical protein [Kitasatospora phosalacinea]|uniref:hypothetical protein n=1 Tax=Kitasatospora phosalacinea TaxID=2065 RepID=UPI000524A331|nr:hypothetical protein [Kitasatospora phosalacinea]